MSPQIRIVWLIAAKDLRQRLRDRSAIRIALVAPLAMALIFSSLLGSFTNFHTTYAVVDLDGGPLSRVLQDEVIGSLVTAGVVDIRVVPTEAAASAAVTDGVSAAAFIIPAGFTADIEAGRPTTLGVVGARDEALATEIAQAVGQRFGDGVVALQLSVATVGRLAGAAPDAAARARITQAVSDMPPPVALVDVAASLRQLSVPTYFSAAMAILFLFFAVQIGMISLFTERRDGTLARLLAGPVRPAAVLLGKTLGSFLLGLAALAILVLATTEVIHADWGPPVGVVALLVAAVIAAVGISTLVTSFARTMEAAIGASSAVAITLGILGGTFTPTGQGPEVMSALALATPHGWFLRGLGDLHGSGAQLTDCLPAVAVLLAMGLVPGAIGLLRARRSLEIR